MEDWGHFVVGSLPFAGGERPALHPGAELVHTVTPSGRFWVFACGPFAARPAAVLELLRWASVFRCDLVAEVAWRPLSDPMQIGI